MALMCGPSLLLPLLWRWVEGKETGASLDVVSELFLLRETFRKIKSINHVWSSSETGQGSISWALQRGALITSNLLTAWSCLPLMWGWRTWDVLKSTFRSVTLRFNSWKHESITVAGITWVVFVMFFLTPTIPEIPLTSLKLHTSLKLSYIETSQHAVFRTVYVLLWRKSSFD